MGNVVILYQAGDSRGGHGPGRRHLRLSISSELTFDRAQVEKNNQNQESNSASPMTVAFKAPPQCEEGRGGTRKTALEDR